MLCRIYSSWSRGVDITLGEIFYSGWVSRLNDFLGMIPLFQPYSPKNYEIFLNVWVTNHLTWLNRTKSGMIYQIQVPSLHSSRMMYHHQWLDIWEKLPQPPCVEKNLWSSHEICHEICHEIPILFISQSHSITSWYSLASSPTFHGWIPSTEFLQLSHEKTTYLLIGE